MAVPFDQNAVPSPAQAASRGDGVSFLQMTAELHKPWCSYRLGLMSSRTVLRLQTRSHIFLYHHLPTDQGSHHLVPSLPAPHLCMEFPDFLNSRLAASHPPTAPAFTPMHTLTAMVSCPSSPEGPCAHSSSVTLQLGHMVGELPLETLCPPHPPFLASQCLATAFCHSAHQAGTASPTRLHCTLGYVRPLSDLCSQPLVPQGWRDHA